MKTSVGLLLALAATVCASKTPINWDEVKPIYELYPHLVPRVARPGGSRITGGHESVPHSRPHQVALLLTTSKGTAFCGGSLISPEWVLTAAHCAEPATSAEVILGAHNVRETESSQQRMTTTQFIIHENWSSQNLQNDIALLVLPQPAELNEYVNTIRLPSRSQLNENFVNDEVLASGWGKSSDDATGVSPTLQEVVSEVISNSNCNSRYFGVIKASHICMSGSNGKSTCSGDSGGPLAVTESDGKLTQVGIVSFGISFGCEKGWPAVFSRVTYFMEWISSKTGLPIRN